MTEQSVKKLEEDIGEMKLDIKEMNKENKKTNEGINELKILIAGEYVKRDEFEKHKEQNESNHTKLWSSIIGLGIFIFGMLFNMLFKLLS